MHQLLCAERLRLHKFGLGVQRGVGAPELVQIHVALRLLLAPTVLFDKFLKFFDRVDHVNASASVEASRFQNPNILPDEVAHRHDETTRLLREMLNAWPIFCRVPRH